MGLTQGSRNTQLSLMVLSAVAVMAQAGVARADDAPATKLETIQVTGSSIRRTDTETPAPVQVISDEDIKKSGYTSIAEVLTHISANNQGTLSSSNPNGFSGGASGVSLRGLTVGATLVLIDGHRVAPYPLSDDAERNFVDVEAIPFDAVDRIEVLKDGASAIYGSDAIAGVVNVILKKHYTGTKISTDLGVSKYGDGGTQRISILHGLKFGDSTDGLFNAEYRHQSAISILNRPKYLTGQDFTAIGGINNTPGTPNLLNNGFPRTLTGYVLNPSGTITSLPGCSPSSSNYAGTSANGGAFCSYQPNGLVSPDTHNLNLLGRLNTALNDSWDSTTTLSAFVSTGESLNGLNSTGGTGGLLYSSLGYGIPTGTYPSSGVPYTVNGSDGGTLFYNFPGEGQSHVAFDTTNYRLAEDLKGTFYGWDVDAGGGLTKGISHVKLTGSLSIKGLQQLQGANPNATTAQLVGIFTAPGAQGILAPPSDATSTSEIDYLSVNGSREIAKLPGGPLSVALGWDMYYQQQSHVSPSIVENGYTNGLDPYAHGSQTVNALHAELDGQVTKELELTAAARVDSINSYGTSTTPKIGFKFKPVEEVLFRGTYSRGFRAPNISERTGAYAFGLGGQADPALCPGGFANQGVPQVGDFQGQCNIGLAYVQAPNTALQPEKSRSYTLGVVFEPIKDVSISADYYDILLKNQIQTAAEQATFDPFSPQYAVRAPAGQLIPTVIGFTPAGAPIYGAPQPTPFGTVNYVTTPWINLTSTEVAGIDLEIEGKYKFGDIGKVDSKMEVSHIYRFLLNNAGNVYELAGTHGPSGISGDTGTPQTRISWTNTFERPDWSVAATINYISSFAAADPSTGAYSTCKGALSSAGEGLTVPFYGLPVPNNFCSIASFTTLDLYGKWNVDKHWTVHGSIVNALGREAPLDLATYGSSGVYNPAYHEGGVIGRYFTVGANYDF